MRASARSSSIAAMLASLWFVADAAEEGRSVVLSMLVVGLIFLAVIGLGELNNYRNAKRKQAKLNRTL
jgi:hypothetical protein